MHYYFITGTSSGIGYELALQILARPNVKVFGISRTCTIEHNQYKHVFADIAREIDVSELAQLFNQSYTLEDSVYLINNAGVIDPIKYVGSFSEFEIQRLLQVNLVAAIQLINAFLKIPIHTVKDRVVLSVSSGAATKVIDGWSLYGTAKAGLDHFSSHVAAELELAGDLRTRIFSVAPGVVDTPMQRKIRAADLNFFSTKDTFCELHTSNNLEKPTSIALKYLHILDKPMDFTKTIFSLREISA